MEEISLSTFVLKCVWRFSYFNGCQNSLYLTSQSCGSLGPDDQQQLFYLDVSGTDVTDEQLPLPGTAPQEDAAVHHMLQEASTVPAPPLRVAIIVPVLARTQGDVKDVAVLLESLARSVRHAEAAGEVVVLSTTVVDDGSPFSLAQQVSAERGWSASAAAAAEATPPLRHPAGGGVAPTPPTPPATAAAVLNVIERASLSVPAEERRRRRHLPSSAAAGGGGVGSQSATAVAAVIAGEEQGQTGVDGGMTLITVLRHDRNRGPAAARNAGVRFALQQQQRERQSIANSAELVLFTDADVEVSEQWVLELARAYRRRSQTQQHLTPPTAGGVILSGNTVALGPRPLADYHNRRVPAVALLLRLAMTQSAGRKVVEEIAARPTLTAKKPSILPSLAGSADGCCCHRAGTGRSTAG